MKPTVLPVPTADDDFRPARWLRNHHLQSMLASTAWRRGRLVRQSAALVAAFSRAKAAMVEGRPYLLDIYIKREGLGAVSEWHPAYSVADQRTRKV